MVYDPKAVGARLKAKREEHGLSYCRLSAETGLRRGTIQAIENGRRSSHSTTLFLLCSALGCSADWVLGLEEGR